MFNLNRGGLPRLLLVGLLLTALLLVACGGEAPGEPPAEPTPAAPTAETEPSTPTPEPVPTEAEPTAEPTEAVALPEISAVVANSDDVPAYEMLELTLDASAEYANPYDARDVRLSGTFTAPDGETMTVPGFWDGEEAWRVRFTPWQEGDWQYELVLEDANGSSEPATGSFGVTASDNHGWLLPGNAVNPDYSGHYLVYHDGTPFYGLGHGEALNILVDGFDADTGVGLFDNMVAEGENYVVWWPFYNNSLVATDYDDYKQSNLNLYDLIVADAQAKGVHLIFTIWDHPSLRDREHAWGPGNWARNGFNQITDVQGFFTDEESWAWQENLYRYMIARWGYSPAIGMWQTVSEINGTEAYDNTDDWHNRVNAYFVENDPYRHPTTASKSGDVDWEEGHNNMDAPQVHVYDFEGDDAVASAEIMAYWTELMFERADAPNWIGEFGVRGNSYYPELYHNSVWASLAAGAAMAPAEWNDAGAFMSMTPEMLAVLRSVGTFVDGMPLAEIDPQTLRIDSSDSAVRGWGVAGADDGFIWVQDFAMQGQPIEAIRADETVRSGVVLTVDGLGDGTYLITPYDTWTATYLDAFEVTCEAGTPCEVPLPDFEDDRAFKISRP